MIHDTIVDHSRRLPIWCSGLRSIQLRECEQTGEQANQIGRIDIIAIIFAVQAIKYSCVLTMSRLRTCELRGGHNVLWQLELGSMVSPATLEHINSQSCALARSVDIKT
jgi:hypothetical protein